MKRHPRTDDDTTTALDLLERVSQSVPMRKHAHTHSALVPWSLIAELREFLWTLPTGTDPERISIVRDVDCPECGYPETYAEGPSDGTPDTLGCRKCGWLATVKVAP